MLSNGNFTDVRVYVCLSKKLDVLNFETTFN